MKNKDKKKERTVPTENGVYNLCGKYCPDCNQFKDWLSFGNHSSTFTGFRGSCKQCQRKMANERLEKNRDEINRKRREQARTEEGRKKKAEEWAAIPLERRRAYIKNRKEKLKNNPELKERKLAQDRKRYELLKDSPKYDEYKEKEQMRGERWRNSLAKYENHFQGLIDSFEVPRKTEKGYLEVKCATCREYFIPTNIAVMNRKQSILGHSKGENRLYCSEECKASCAVYGTIDYPKNYKLLRPAKNRYDPNLIREIAFSLYGETCELCESVSGRNKLIIHHEFPVKLFPEYELDSINWWVLCSKCHTKLHKIKGCSKIELSKTKGGRLCLPSEKA